MFKKGSGRQLSYTALIITCGALLSACAVSLPGGLGAVILAIIMAVLIFRPPCAQDAQAAAGDGDIVTDDKAVPGDGPQGGDRSKGEGKGGSDVGQGDIKTTPCLQPPHPCLSTSACLCTCELQDPSLGPVTDTPAAPAADLLALDRDRQRARQRLGQRLPDDLRQRLSS